MSWSFWLYPAALIVYGACLLRYGFGAPWWSSWTGRAQISLYGALVAVLLLVVAARFATLSPWLLGWLRAGSMGTVVAVGIAHFVNIGRLLRKYRARPPGPPRRRAEDQAGVTPGGGE